MRVSARRARPAAALLLGIALLAVFGLVARSEGAFPGRPGVIAYDDSGQSGGGSSEETCRSESDSIFTVPPDGSHRAKLAKGADQSYSPNGKLIVFSTCDGVQE